MRSPRFLILALLALAALSACGKKIGDGCQIPSDCSSDGDRICDLTPPDGYCTIAGCDFGTCPSEAVCVRFYPGSDDAAPCQAHADCSFDEICAVSGHCAQRASEIRFCMLKCEGDGDCRDGYECRTKAIMMIHGGEPVPDPALETGMSDFQPFCAQRKVCNVVTACSVRELCDFDTRTCAPRPTCSSSGGGCDPNSTIEICNPSIGQCVRPCTQQIDCELTETCNTTTQFCESN